MSENNTEPKITEETIEDEFLYIPDYGPDESDSSDDEKKIFEQIGERESNIEEYVAPEMNFFQKIGEFWYRNKPLILIGAGAIALLVFIIVTALPGKYDLTTTIYVSYSDFPSTISFEMIDELEDHVEDWDETGDISVSVSTVNLGTNEGVITAVNMEKLLAHINDEPTSMLWVVDEDLYEMILRDYGEYLFESFEGEPLWIEITSNEIINSCIERSECPRLGFCLRAMTDELAQNEELCASYERAKLTLADIREQHPEMFTAQ